MNNVLLFLITLKYGFFIINPLFCDAQIDKTITYIGRLG